MTGGLCPSQTPSARARRHRRALTPVVGTIALLQLGCARYWGRQPNGISPGEMCVLGTTLGWTMSPGAAQNAAGGEQGELLGWFLAGWRAWVSIPASLGRHCSLGDMFSSTFPCESQLHSLSHPSLSCQSSGTEVTPGFGVAQEGW